MHTTITFLIRFSFCFLIIIVSLTLSKIQVIGMVSDDALTNNPKLIEVQRRE